MVDTFLRKIFLKFLVVEFSTFISAKNLHINSSIAKDFIDDVVETTKGFRLLDNAKNIAIA